MIKLFAVVPPVVWAVVPAICAGDPEVTVREDRDSVTIDTPELSAVVRKKGYVTGIAGGSFLDKKTGFRDAGFGLDIVDWIMEPGSDLAYRDKLEKEMWYRNDGEFRLYHGDRPKRCIEGPQVCTQAKEVSPRVVRGKDFLAVEQTFTYRTSAPGKKTGSRWTQWIVFPAGKRYFISMDRIDTVNSSEAMFLRLDMPAHIKHNKGDTFSEIYLSYGSYPPDFGRKSGQGAIIKQEGEGLRIPSAIFHDNFRPDLAFDYRRNQERTVPGRFIRAYRLRDPKTGKDGPWLAGMTLEPSVVSEAWCHQRGYVCMIEEFGGRPIKAGEHFSAAFIVGYFDSIDEMHEVYDRYKGHTGLKVDENGWELTK